MRYAAPLLAILLAALASTGCAKPAARTQDPGSAAPGPVVPLPTLAAPAATCAKGAPLTLHFYDVGQALAVLVDLPDGRHVLVDAADDPRREGCGEVCARAHAHLLDRLRADLRGAPIDLLWITHPHSDHVGGAAGVLERFPVAVYVDNGRDGGKAEVRRAREAAAAHGAQVRVVDPEHAADPRLDEPGSREPQTTRGSSCVTLTPVVPSAWPRGCREDENECSIALRIDAGASSVLLTGDAEHAEEARLDPGGPVTLLQVGHHGSDTSTSASLLARLRPRYAVISAGRPGEGLNADYCHPRARVVERLTRALGGETTRPLRAFDGVRCETDRGADPRARGADQGARGGTGGWIDVPASDRLWATERDGDVVLATTGDGVFRRVR